MTQILIFGASVTYGVGGPHGGWADMLKLQLHDQMYNKKQGERHEVHNFAKPGATISFVESTYGNQIKNYRRDNRNTIAILSVGMNDSKAVNSPINYLNTPEAYQSSMQALVKSIRKQVDTVICVGFTQVNEALVEPKHDPLTGNDSFFTNQRLRTFNTAFRESCDAQNVHFVDLFDNLPDDWISEYLFSDGLHPNDRGYDYMFSQIMPVIQDLL